MMWAGKDAIFQGVKSMCMCGDTYCWSCGPSQGNSKCDHCGMWSADGGCANPEKCEEAEKQRAEQEAAWDRQYGYDVELPFAENH